MKKSAFFLTVFAFSLLIHNGVFAQTGIFYFGDSTSEYVNNRIISIKESPNGDLYLLGKATDSRFGSLHPYFAITEKSGKLIFHKTLEITHAAYELTSMLIDTDGKIKIYGTEINEGRMFPMLKVINRNGESPTTESIMVNTNTLTGEVRPFDADHFIFSKTVQSSTSGMYHISIMKQASDDYAQIWYKTLPLDHNEEVNKVLVLKDKSIVVIGKLYDIALSEFTPLIYKLSADGEVLWRKAPEVFTSFFEHGIAEGKDGKLLYVCSANYEQMGSAETKMLTLNAAGETIKTETLPNFRANGNLSLKNGNILLYGAHVKVTGNSAIPKAKFILYDANLKKVKEDELGMFDAPDALLPSLAMTVNPTSSDIFTAAELNDGRIICGGRLYMPVKTHPDEILLSERINKALLIIMSKDGNFRKP